MKPVSLPKYDSPDDNIPLYKAAMLMMQVVSIVTFFMCNDLKKKKIVGSFLIPNSITNTIFFVYHK